MESGFGLDSASGRVSAFGPESALGEERGLGRSNESNGSGGTWAKAGPAQSSAAPHDDRIRSTHAS